MKTQLDQQRRAFLHQMTALGAAGLSGAILTACTTPRPVVSGMMKVHGKVWINGLQATADATAATPGIPKVPSDAIVTTGPDSHAVFVIGQDAFLLRANSRLELISDMEASLFSVLAENRASDTIQTDMGTSLRVVKKKPKKINGFFLASGKILSVFGSGSRSLKTPYAAIGIRGTGAYLETSPDRTYICTCYGTADIRSVQDPEVQETVTTTHHESPRFIFADHHTPRIEKATMFNHTDEELFMLEHLVGREPAFYDPFADNESY